MTFSDAIFIKMLLNLNLVDFTISELGDLLQNLEDVLDFAVSPLLLELSNEMPNLTLNKRAVVEQATVDVENVWKHTKTAFSVRRD